MTANPTTDQLLAAVQDATREVPPPPATQTMLTTFADRISADLPAIAPQLIGQVLLHAAIQCRDADAVISGMFSLGGRAVVNILALAGEKLYTTPAEMSGT